jgi:hypothetical protein
VTEVTSQSAEFAVYCGLWLDDGQTFHNLVT